MALSGRAPRVATYSTRSTPACAGSASSTSICCRCTSPTRRRRSTRRCARSGRARYVGCSNFAAWQVVEAQWIARDHLSPFITAQNQYNLLDRRIERELVPACRQHGLGILPYFPLASGFLTGKYRRGEEPPKDTRLGAQGARAAAMLSEPNFDTLSRLEAFATERGHTMIELAIGWLASHAYVPSVIAGATRPEQVAQNAAAAAWKLSADEMAQVDAITQR